MTREHKLALIVGFALVLVVGVLVSDHFSSARKSQPRSGIMALGPQEAGADVPQPTIASSIPPGSGGYGAYGSSGVRDWPVAMPPTDPVDPTAAIAYTDPTSVIAPSGTDRSAPPYQPGVTVPGGMPAQSPQPVTVVMGPQGGGGSPLPNNGALAGPDRISTGTGTGTGTGSGIPGFVPVGGTPDATSPSSSMGGTQPPAVQPETQVPAAPSLPVSTGKVQKRSIREGESLYGLAEEFYGDPNLWTKLRDFNKGKIGSNGSIREGVTLTFPPKDVLLGKAVLPGQGQPAGTRAAPASAPSTPTRVSPGVGSGSAIAGTPASVSNAGKTYTMQKGDVLSMVAKKTLGSARRWQELVDANPGVIDDPDNIPAGTVLKIPAR